MACRFVADENASCHVEGEHPVPDGWSASLIVLLRKDPFCRLESISLADSDGKPDQVEHKVQDNHGSASSEDPLVCPCGQIVEADGDEEESFGDDPLHCTELDVVDIGGVVKAKDCDFREQEISCSLGERRDKCRPRSAGPPSDHEAEESSEARSTGFCRPAVTLLSA